MEPMTQILQPLVVPAFVAAFVTLVIEWAAKPRLEARKDRVVEAYREMRAVANRLADVGRVLAELSSPAVWQYPPLVKQRILELHTLGEQLRATPGTVMLGCPPVVRSLLPSATGLLIGRSISLLALHESEDEHVDHRRFREEFESPLREYFDPLADWFHLQRSHIRRISTVRQLEELALARSRPDATEGEPPPDS